MKIIVFIKLNKEGIYNKLIFYIKGSNTNYNQLIYITGNKLIFIILLLINKLCKLIILLKIECKYKYILAY